MIAQFSGKNTLRVLGFVALATASVAALAQSADYRRGYEQGYSDGLAAQVREGGRRDFERIHIVEASYGTRDASCDARDTVRRLAGGRRNVDIVVNNDICGDPAEGRHKRLVVEYRCGDGPIQRTEMRETGIMSLYCR